MASIDVLQSMKDEALCPICLEFFVEPVTIDCGHNFCRTCIVRHWQSERGPATCPQCRALLPDKTLRHNRFVSNIVENVMKLRVDEAVVQTELRCQEHDERLKVYCSDDQRPICVVCATSRHHHGHSTSPLGEAAELHKDIKQLLDRCKQEYIAPTDFPTDLHTDSIITPFRYVKIWDELKALVPARESLKLNARTAHPRLLLSEDLRSVVDGEKRRECSLSPQRFNYWLCVLADSGFKSGRHYWDVELGGNQACVLGVASELADRLITGPLVPQDGYWVLEMVNGNLVNLGGPGPQSLPLRHKPQTVRVYLDYEEGHLAFYDADSLCHLYTLHHKFTQTLLPLFNPHNKKEGSSGPLRLAP